jgi:cardiolipin synthase (CMP-forming)
MQRCGLSPSRSVSVITSFLNRPPRWINENSLKLSSFLCTDVKKSSTNLSVKSVKGAEILQEALEKRKKKYQETKLQFQEKKQQLQDNIRDKKSKVEEVIIRENIFTIPNFLCISRIAMSPYLGYTIIHADYKIAMGIMLAAAFTDLADGYIARNWEGQKSNFGSFLDPLADKTLVTTLVITLTYADLMPLWLTSMIVFRDVFLIVAAFVIRYNSLPPEHRTLTKYFDATHVTAQLAPTFISKVNTVVQLFTIAVSLGAPIFDYVDHSVLHSLWYFTGATTLAAAFSYYSERKNTYKYLRKSLEKGKK